MKQRKKTENSKGASLKEMNVAYAVANRALSSSVPITSSTADTSVRAMKAATLLLCAITLASGSSRTYSRFRPNLATDGQKIIRKSPSDFSHGNAPELSGPKMNGGHSKDLSALLR